MNLIKKPTSISEDMAEILYDFSSDVINLTFNDDLNLLTVDASSHSDYAHAAIKDLITKLKIKMVLETNEYHLQLQIIFSTTYPHMSVIFNIYYDNEYNKALSFIDTFFDCDDLPNTMFVRELLEIEHSEGENIGFARMLKFHKYPSNIFIKLNSRMSIREMINVIYSWARVE